MTATNSIDPNEARKLAAELDALGERLRRVRQSLGQVIFGQETVIEQSLVTVLSGAHGLLVGVPGLAKTKLVETLGHVLGLETKRVQCTPDLMPADILGSEVLEEGESGRRNFRFIQGPIFTQLFMADEINRASPRTQSALLQAMQEHRVSVAGHYHGLPQPFHVLATQNPIEQEGTYPLPEAQLDRFMMEITVDYPDLESERRMLIATTGTEAAFAHPVMGAMELHAAQRLVRQVPVGESVVEAILDIVRRARPGDTAAAGDEKAWRGSIAWGPGPRASQALLMAARARAVIEGRLSPSIDDVLDFARPVLRHRMALHYGARADGITVDGIIDRLTQRYR